jgi:hypothetical protein
MADTTVPKAASPARAMILPLALAQFIASYAATNMNVAISAIATDLGTTVAGLIVYGAGGLIVLLSYPAGSGGGLDHPDTDPGHHRHPGRLRGCRQIRQAASAAAAASA